MDIEKVKKARRIVNQAEDEILKYVDEYMKEGIILHVETATSCYGEEKHFERNGVKISLKFKLKLMATYN